MRLLLTPTAVNTMEGPLERVATAGRVRLPNGGTEIFPTLPVRLSPDRKLLLYYTITSFALGPAFIFMLVPMYFRFRSMRYEIDDEGISMRWGVLFRREISLTYTRIQDIHLSSNFVERWMGLGRIQVQTASGSAGAEMTIEGLPHPDAVRDFLYARMRGARGERGGSPKQAAEQSPDAALSTTLREIAAEVRALRADLARSREGSDVR